MRVTGFEGFEGQAPSRQAIVVADDAIAADDARQAARAAGVGIAATIGFSGIAAALADTAYADVLLVDAAGVAPALLDVALPLLRARMAQDRAQLVVSFPTDAIDIVTLHLLGCPAILLCDAAPQERVAAIAIGAVVGNRIQATERDAERLRRLNEAIARIAETLARLAQDDAAADALHDRSVDFAAPAPTAPDESGVSAATVRGAIRARRLRAQFFPRDLFADPAWDMLLDLFAAQLEGEYVSVSSLCIAAAVPPTTALRWITTMNDAGLFGRKDDPADRRRAFVVLTARGSAGMHGYAQAMAKAGLAWG